jgi:hypothetical protein
MLPHPNNRCPSAARNATPYSPIIPVEPARKNVRAAVFCAVATPLHGSHIDLHLRFLKNYPSGKGCFSTLSGSFMELLLNLAWLLLALPAFCLWRGSRNSCAEHKSSSLQCLLALGCALVILFPVVSATDDLIAMRTEMEESPISKRSIRLTSHDKASAWNARSQTASALLGTSWSFALATEHRELPKSLSISPPAAPSILPAGRAPPVSCIA